MNRSRETPLGEHLPARASEDRIARQWEALGDRMPSRARKRSAALTRVVAVSALTIAAAGIAFRLGRTRSEAKAPVDPEILMLPDGSRGVLEPASRIAVATASPDHILLVLEAGGIHLEVPPSDTRTFIVRAAGYDAEVLGTAFRVSIDKREGRDVVAVGVTHGSVKVSRPDHSIAGILRSGETFTETLGSKRASSTVTPAPSSNVAQAPEPDQPPSSPSARETGLSAGAGESAKEMLARATEARAAGRAKEAAVLLDNLRKRHRGDSRAGLAAFELGRLRFDVLADISGAVEAFEDAIALAPNAPFREDAEARRIEALDTAGDPRCSVARAAYLARYPGGLHARAVATRCARR
jgi:hypothetical protein